MYHQNMYTCVLANHAQNLFILLTSFSYLSQEYLWNRLVGHVGVEQLTDVTWSQLSNEVVWLEWKRCGLKKLTTIIITEDNRFAVKN